MALVIYITKTKKPIYQEVSRNENDDAIPHCLANKNYVDIINIAQL